MKVVCISDTHNNPLDSFMKDLYGDILIHAGDLTALGRHGETQKALSRLAAMHDRFDLIVLVAGNHDFLAQRDSGLFKQMCREKGIVYLEDSSFSHRDCLIYGSPWTPPFYNWAFMESEADLARRFRWIPEDTDILVTHGPPRYILDQNFDKEHCGSQALCERVSTVRPKLHVFGHIHHSHGEMDFNSTKFVNAALTDDRNQLTQHQKPIVVEL